MASINTDAAIGVILGNFSSDYIRHVMYDSLDISNRFRPFTEPMPNFVDVLNRNFTAALAEGPDYTEQILNVRSETWREIILMICKYYNLQFCQDFDMIDPVELYGIAHTMYEIFVSSYTQYAINFYTQYIINNADYISSYLAQSPESIKPKEVGVYDKKGFIDPKYILIHANINRVITNMASYDISLDELLKYFLDTPSYMRMTTLLRDCGDIYKYFYAPCILDPMYASGILTNVKLQLQSRTYEAREIDTK